MAKTKTPAPEAEAPVETVNDPAAVNADPVDAGEAAKGNKSVVPSKYAGKYKKGGEAYNAPLAVFIRAQCGEDDKFEFPAFFALCRQNGIPEEKVAHYEAQVATKANGVNGRARMTLANMLRAKARKDQKLKDLSGNDVDVPEPKLPASGAAAKPATPDTAPAGSEVGSAEPTTEPVVETAAE